MNLDDTRSLAIATLTDQDGNVLVIRRRNTGFFTQPDALIDEGADALAVLRKALWQDLGINLPTDAFAPMGSYGSWIVGEMTRPVDAQAFAARVIYRDVTPQEGVAEAVWVNPAAPHVGPLAPLTEETILPRIVDAMGG